MSSEIDYQRKAFKYEDKFGGTAYIVLHETGSSNCFDGPGRNAKRSRSWRVLVDGSQYQVTREICEYAGHSAGGMLRLNRMGTWSSDFKVPLQFIRAYDKALKAALPIEQAEGWDYQVINTYRTKKAQEVA